MQHCSYLGCPLARTTDTQWPKFQFQSQINEKHGQGTHSTKVGALLIFVGKM
jgi:hypothetical protein